MRNLKALLTFLSLVSLAATAADLDQIKKTKLLRYCYFARFGDDVNKSHRGPDVELLESFAQSLGVPTKGRRIRWEELFENTKGEVDKEGAYTPALFVRDECDLYATSMTITDWRLKKIDIIPIHPARVMVMVRRDSPLSIKKVSDLGGKRTVVSKATTLLEVMTEVNETALKDNPIQIRTVSLGGTTKELLDRKVDFIFMDSSQALQFLNENRSAVKLAFVVGPNQALGWGFKKGTIALEDAFKKFLKRQRSNSNSQMNGIFKKYYGVSVDEFESIVQFSQSQEAAR